LGPEISLLAAGSPVLMMILVCRWLQQWPANWRAGSGADSRGSWFDRPANRSTWCSAGTCECNCMCVQL